VNMSLYFYQHYRRPISLNFGGPKNAIILVFWSQRSQRNSNGVAPKRGGVG